MRVEFLVAAAYLAAAPVLAQGVSHDLTLAPFLTLPLRCELGRTCYVEDYVDADPGPDQSDYACGLNSRDGHNGTDFALVSLTSFAAGVDVIAAAGGRVAAVRDGMPDLPYSVDHANLVLGRECGNAVRIEHENGLETLYCHLRRGSLRVQKGAVVARGDVLGLVGMSGLSNYPHVHLGVLNQGERIDPFAPKSDDVCAQWNATNTLWKTAIPYVETGLFAVAFSDHIPSFASVKSGDARVTSATPNVPLVLYAHFHHAQDGDLLFLQAESDEGVVFETTQTLDKTQVNMFRAFGRKAPDGGWPPGTYTGTVHLERDGRVLAVRFVEIDIP